MGKPRTSLPQSVHPNASKASHTCVRVTGENASRLRECALCLRFLPGLESFEERS